MNDNPSNNPATPRQTFCLYCATGKDFRPLNLSKEVASQIIGAIQPFRGNKKSALEIAEKLLNGQTVSAPIAALSKSEQFQILFDKAWAAGREAAQSAQVVPMIVGHPTSPLGDDINPDKPVYFVEGGVCGFAWVSVRPGNCSFANWLKKNDLGRTDSYAGGVVVSISDYGQSLQRKESHAHAMAKVLRDAGIKAYGESRID